MSFYQRRKLHQFILPISTYVIEKIEFRRLKLSLIDIFGLKILDISYG